MNDDTIDWHIVEWVDHWLDSEVSQEYKDQPLAQDWARISKVGEELGEAIDAFIAITGQNPRKRRQLKDNKEMMLNELADVVMTGILALHHFTKDTSEVRKILMVKQQAIYQRIVNA
jgi:hypothetical protein